MEFKFTDEQELIRKNACEFAAKHVEPIAAEIDQNGRHPAELFKKLAEGGWMGIPIPEQYGGAGGDFMTHAIVVEEIARACTSTGFTLSFHAGIIGTILNLFGNEDQKKKYLIPLAQGQHLGAGLRQNSRYISINSVDRIDISPYYLHAIWQSDNRRHLWKMN
jgi:butyryl-CoA dehydrogenase